MGWGALASVKGQSRYIRVSPLGIIGSNHTDDGHPLAPHAQEQHRTVLRLGTRAPWSVLALFGVLT